MRIRTIVIVSAGAAVLVVAGLGWSWWSAPTPPAVPLDQMEKPVADAVTAARDAVLREPRSASAWGELGMVLAANGFAEEAVTCFAQAEQLDAADPRWPYLRGDALSGSDPRQSRRLLEKALDRAGDGPAANAIAFRLALALLEDGQLDEAERHLKGLAAGDPDDLRVRFGLGLLAAARDDRPAARAQLLPLDDSPFVRKRACSQLAALALADGETEQAHAYQQRASAYPPDAPWPDPFMETQAAHAASRQARFLRAEALEGQGRAREALVILRQIVAATPDARAHLALGLLLAKQQEFDEAETALRSASAADPTNAQAAHLLASVLLARADRLSRTGGSGEQASDLYRQAVAAEDRALALQPTLAMAHLTRGKALLALKRTDEALQALKEAVVGRPEFADTHLAYGEALVEAGRARDAVPHLEAAVRLAVPGDPRPARALEKARATLSPKAPPR